MAEADITDRSTDTTHNVKDTSYFSDFLHGYAATENTEALDILDGRYHIDGGTPLPQFNTKTALAFAARDQERPDRVLYAIVMQPNHVPRIRVLKELITNPPPNMACPVAYGPVKLSQGNAVRFVIIHERPAGPRLTAVMEKAGKAGEEFIRKRIVDPIGHAIFHLESLGISHGRINPDSIYLSDKTTLGECISEPCGLTQPFHFEPLERIQCQPSGKGNGERQDYYALGVTVLFCVYGAKHLSAIPEEKLRHSILREGTYYALTRGKRHPEALDDLLRGMLHDQPEDRWSSNQLKPWLTGRHFNVLAPPSPTSNIRPYDFAGTSVYTRREMAEQFFKRWIEMPTALRDNQFLHWITVSLRKKALAENIERCIVTMEDLGAKHELQLNEQLMRIVLMLDPTGPVRMYPLSFFPDGIDSFYNDLYINNKKQELNLLIHFLEQNMMLFWVNLCNDDKNEDEAQNSPMHGVIERLDRMRVALRNKGPGFGAERILYELNPSLPCQSPLVKDKCVMSSEAMLRALDSQAASLGNSASALDNHIFAFLASRLGIQNSIGLRELQNMPDLAASKACIALHIFSMAQYRCGNITFPGLTHWLGKLLLPEFEAIRSHSVRELVQKKLKETAATGKAQTMAKAVINADLIDRDFHSYQLAYERYHRNAKIIDNLKKGKPLNRRSAVVGNAIAKYIAYTILALTLFITMQEHII